MIRLVQAELLKLRTARSLLLLAGAAVLTAGLPLLAFIAPGTPVEVVELSGTLPGVSLGGVELSAFLVMLLAVIGTAGEFHHGTAVSTFLAAPDRYRVVLAKVGAYAAAGAVLALAAGLASLVLFPAGAALAGVELVAAPAEVLRALAATAAMGASFGALGVAVGGLIRNQTAAALAALGWFFVAESILPIVMVGTADDVLPGAAAAALAGLSETSRLVGVAVLAAWVAALTAGATRAIAWRDVA